MGTPLNRAGALALLAVSTLWGQGDLERNFVHPPASVRPRAFWMWMNGNVSRRGITLDLEAMKRVGIGGVMMFDGGAYLPPGPAGFLSPAWRELMAHAVREGERLGVEVGMHNAPGWSSSGGPWITPDRAMQQLVWTETTVHGPGRKQIALEKPRTHLGYYRDALVLAFPAPRGEEVPYASLVKGIIRAPDALTVEFKEPFDARAVTVQAAFGGRLPNVTLEASEDGASYRPLVTLSNPGKHGIQPPAVRSFAPVIARYFRLSGKGAGELGEVVLHHTARIHDWNYKANFAYRVGGQVEMPEPIFGDTAIDPRSVRDLTPLLNAEGVLHWEVPSGDWIVLRLGHTPTGQLNVSASDAGRGLECDKLSREATDFHFSSVVARIPGLRSVIIDSYETGMQNWTAGFPEEFRKRAGYDPRPYLPAMIGRIVGNRGVSERFLFDVRRVQADMMAGNYYGRMRELCGQRGLRFYVEGYGQGVFDEMQVSGIPDVPSAEFWERTPWTPNRVVRMVASAAHVYGKPVVAAEAFTGEEQTARWLEYPYSLKALGDLMFSQGVNEFVFHRYAHQPHPTAVPGMSMGPWGFHMDRTNTWFEQSAPWIEYLMRCQYLLRQGTAVADILHFTGERPPGAENFDVPVEPTGFHYDLINADALLNRTSVRDGQIVIRDGGSYRILVLPPDLQGATPELMRKLREMVKQGARVVGPKPRFSPTLRGFPESDTEVKRIADELWNNGRIASKGDPRVAPDFECAGRKPDTALSWTHRRTADAEIYFVANRQRRTEDVECAFRVADRVPEFWNPETGEIRRAALYSIAGGRTRVPLHLEPVGSVFVVFRERAGGAAPNAWIAYDGVIPPVPAAAAPGIENTFTLALWAKPDTDLRGMPQESTSGKIDETGKFYAIPAGEGDVLFGRGHAAAGLAIGRNGAYIVERSSTSSPAVLVANAPISGWTHFAVVYRQGKPQLYIDGKLAREGLTSKRTVHPGVGNPPPLPETSYSFTGLDNLLRASARPPQPSNGLAYYFEGNLTEPQVFDRALREDEIRAMVLRGIPPPETPVKAEVWRRADGKIEAQIWRSGRYSLPNGASANAKVPEPRILEGPWKVAFQEGRGAPASIMLPQLGSWHRQPDAGVKYFSGTATYLRSLDVPDPFLEPGRRVVLDLGRVEVVAEVRINGRSVGVLWKEPYRIDVTDAVHAGANDLEIRVTNLWTNRLIGDENLAAENEYQAGGEHGIVSLPEWYRQGKPKPAGGRITFTTWKFYQPGDPLVESGLLGPVRLLNPVRVLMSPGP